MIPDEAVEAVMASIEESEKAAGTEFVPLVVPERLRGSDNATTVQAMLLRLERKAR